MICCTFTFLSLLVLTKRKGAIIMKAKKILAILLSIIMTFSLVVTAQATTKEESGIIAVNVCPRFANISILEANISISNRTANCTCSISLYRTSTVEICFVLQRSSTGTSGWSDYRNLGTTTDTTSGELVRTKTSSALPTGYYYRLKAIVEVTAGSAVDETTIYSTVKKI